MQNIKTAVTISITMDKNVFLQRMEKIRKIMAEKNTDVFLVSPSSNLFYLTGYAVGADERLFLLVLPREGEPFIIANQLYKLQVDPLPVKTQVYWKDGEDPFRIFKTEIEKQNIRMKTAALEPQMHALFSVPLNETFSDVKFILASSMIDPVRQIKDKSELDLIRKACRESDSALAALIEKGTYWLGKNEIDLYRALSAEFENRDLTNFGSSIQYGANAAIPHYTTGKVKIENGNCLLIDFWGRYNGYCTDCTRTFHFGKPDSEFEKIYAIVLEAYLAGEAKARAGNNLEDVDLAARAVIEKYGYGEYFTHRTGHGIGIDGHEGDSVNKGVKVLIEPGMIFSIEPGIYLPGRYGVRLENCVAVTKTGIEVLHSYPRELKLIN